MGHLEPENDGTLAIDGPVKLLRLLLGVLVGVFGCGEAVLKFDGVPFAVSVLIDAIDDMAVLRTAVGKEVVVFHEDEVVVGVVAYRFGQMKIYSLSDATQRDSHLQVLPGRSSVRVENSVLITAALGPFQLFPFFAKHGLRTPRHLRQIGNPFICQSGDVLLESAVDETIVRTTALHENAGAHALHKADNTEGEKVIMIQEQA